MKVDPEIVRAMRIIILESKWAVHFPKNSLERIREIAELVMEGKPIPLSTIQGMHAEMSEDVNILKCKEYNRARR